jgi:pyrroloquinoline quinone biosynthesis protein D
VLLVPEGLLVVNATGAAILELCDGERSIATIIAELSTRYGDVGPVQQEERQQEVVAFLDRLANRRLVVFHALDALGSSDY